MHKELLQSEYMHGDETTVQVLNVPHQKPTTKSYMWVYKTGRSEEKQMVLFIHENTKSHILVRNHLQDIQESCKRMDIRLMMSLKA